jgi:3'-5' exoribonuclease
MTDAASIENPFSNLESIVALKGRPLETSGAPFEALLLYGKCNTKTAKNGSEYLIVELLDATGTLSVNCFSNTVAFDFFKKAKEGQIVQVKGNTDFYQERLSPRITGVVAVDETYVRANGLMDRLIAASAEHPDLMWEELMGHIQAIQHPELRATVQRVMDEIGDGFKIMPGAISMHHAYKHGLMEHTLHMARAGRALFPLYPEVHADLALAGIILHDIGKTVEYIYEKVTKKSPSGILQGHVVLGYRMARKAALQSGLDEVLLERLEHIILSHQGELEWGAAVMAATPEAVFVSLVDNLDAKMGIVQNALRQQKTGFSAFLPGLKTTLLLEEV